MVWTANNSKMWYLFRGLEINAGQVAWVGFKGFWTFLILLNNLIPISLYISIESAKLVQGIIMSKDLEMYHEDTDTPANVRSSALNEELGQINFIFSDKTGTLTENKMDCKFFSSLIISKLLSSHEMFCWRYFVWYRCD